MILNAVNHLVIACKWNNAYWVSVQAVSYSLNHSFMIGSLVFVVGNGMHSYAYNYGSGMHKNGYVHVAFVSLIFGATMVQLYKCKSCMCIFPHECDHDMSSVPKQDNIIIRNNKSSQECKKVAAAKSVVREHRHWAFSFLPVAMWLLRYIAVIQNLLLYT